MIFIFNFMLPQSILRCSIGFSIWSARLAVRCLATILSWLVPWPAAQLALRPRARWPLHRASRQELEVWGLLRTRRRKQGLSLRPPRSALVLLTLFIIQVFELGVMVLL